MLWSFGAVRAQQKCNRCLAASCFQGAVHLLFYVVEFGCCKSAANVQHVLGCKLLPRGYTFAATVVEARRLNGGSISNCVTPS
jgi:hypothetical protein